MKPRKKKSSKLNFNLAKHDEAVQGRRELEDRVAAGEILQKLGLAWEQMKRRLLHKRKPTVNDLNKFVAEMETTVRRECVGKNLDGFRQFALTLLREKAELLRLSGFNQHNVFTPASVVEPAASPELPSAYQPVQVRYTFNRFEEFASLEPVRRVMKKDGFVGFILEENQVIGVFTDGQYVLMGSVVNGLGMEKVPSKEQYLAALGKGNITEGNKGNEGEREI